MHRYQYTLDLLKQVIEKAPKFFEVGRKKEMEGQLKIFRADGNLPLSKIEDAIIVFGKEIWPFRKAFWHVHDEARIEEEQYIKELLASGTREKYGQFLRKGGRIEDIRKEAQLEDLETFFTSDELTQLVEAKMNAHDRVVAEVDSLCSGTKKEVCVNALGEYTEKQKMIEEFIGALRALADQSEKWKSEILDKVRIFEEGWSGLEREVTADDVKGEIDYYLGVITITES